jgi:hypothetical protein
MDGLAPPHKSRPEEMAPAAWNACLGDVGQSQAGPSAVPGGFPEFELHRCLVHPCKKVHPTKKKVHPTKK